MLVRQKRSRETLRSWRHWGRRSMQRNVLAHFREEPGTIELMYSQCHSCQTCTWASWVPEGMDFSALSPHSHNNLNSFVYITYLLDWIWVWFSGGGNSTCTWLVWAFYCSILFSLLVCLCQCFSFRHSRFGGSFVVQGLKSIGDKDVIYHRKVNNVSNELLQLIWNTKQANSVCRIIWIQISDLFLVQKLHSWHRKSSETCSQEESSGSGV